MNELQQHIATSPRGFQSTHWSLVASAAESSPAALEELCGIYWPPLFLYVCRLGYSPTDAEDLTQAFFVRLLDRKYLALADAERGRFRTFLLTSLRRFLVNEWRNERSIKRGGEASRITLDMPHGRQLAGEQLTHELTPERLFERQWALVVLQRAFQQLESEQTQKAKSDSYRALAPYLTGDQAAPGYESLATQLGTTTAALRMLVVRLRKRLGELIRNEIRQTVGTATEVDDEVRRLFQALQG